MSPWNSFDPLLVTALIAPPVRRPYSAGRPPVMTSTSCTKSGLRRLPWRPTPIEVVFRPSMMYSFSPPDDPYTVTLPAAAPVVSVLVPGATCAAATKLRPIGSERSVSDVTFAPEMFDVTSTTGAVPTTLIVSDAAALSVMSSVTVWFNSTATLFCVTGVNPHSVAVRL